MEEIITGLQILEMIVWPAAILFVWFATMSIFYLVILGVHMVYTRLKEGEWDLTSS